MNHNYPNTKSIIKLSIIIVNYKAQNFLLRCLSSIYQMIEGLDFEVIVVDNASEDNIKDKIKDKFPLVELIVNTVNLGFSKACNQGFREMRGEYALLLNPDAKILDSNFKEMIRFLEENPKVGILGCKVLNEHGEVQRSAFSQPTPLKEVLDIATYLKLEKILPVSWTNRFYDRLINESPHPFEVFWVSGACLLIRGKTLEEIGFLDEKYFLFSEDVDLAWRAKSNGWQVMFFPQTRIIHIIGGSSLEDFESLYLRTLHSYKRRPYFGQKYYSKMGNFLIRVVMLIDLLIRLVYIKFRFDQNDSIKRRKVKLKAYREAFRSVIF